MTSADLYDFEALRVARRQERQNPTTTLMPDDRMTAEHQPTEHLQPSDLVPALATTVRAFLRERKKRDARASATDVMFKPTLSRQLWHARQLAKDPIPCALQLAIFWIGKITYRFGGTKLMHETLDAVIERNPNLKGRIVSAVDHAWSEIGRTEGSKDVWMGAEH